MLDVNDRIVNAGIIDISAAATQSFTAFELGRVGLPVDTYFVVHVTEGTAAAVTPVNWFLEISLDNGSTWDRVAVIEADTITGTYILAVPAGLNDIRPENVQPGSNIDARVTATWTTVASADDITFSAYLAGPQSYQSFN